MGWPQVAILLQEEVGCTEFVVRNLYFFMLRAGSWLTSRHVSVALGIAYERLARKPRTKTEARILITG